MACCHLCELLAMNTPRMMARMLEHDNSEKLKRAHTVRKTFRGDHVFRDAQSIIESDATLQNRSKTQTCCRQSLGKYFFSVPTPTTCDEVRLSRMRRGLQCFPVGAAQSTHNYGNHVWDPHLLSARARRSGALPFQGPSRSDGIHGIQFVKAPCVHLLLVLQLHPRPSRPPCRATSFFCPLFTSHSAAPLLPCWQCNILPARLIENRPLGCLHTSSSMSAMPRSSSSSTSSTSGRTTNSSHQNRLANALLSRSSHSSSSSSPKSCRLRSGTGDLLPTLQRHQDGRMVVHGTARCSNTQQREQK